MKKVLHIKLQAPNFDNNGISNGFRENGYDVTEINWQAYRLNNGTDALRLHMIELAKELKPDIIFMQIQNEAILDVPTVQELSQHGFVVNYTFDVREDISWYKKIALHIGLTLFGDYESVEECKREGIENVEYLQSSCDTDFYKPIEPTKDYGEIIFIGNKYTGTNLNFPFAKERDEMIDFMQKEFGERFKVYGRGYGESLNPEQEREAYSSCKIAITQNMFHRKGYCSDRGFRSISCGAFTIQQKFPLLKILDEFKFMYWETFDELKETCKKVLDFDYIRMFVIGCQDMYLQTGGHTWNNRIKQLESLIEKQLVHG